MAIDTGNTAWLLMSTALVMLMLPGLALFYGGLVRAKNVLSTIMHSFFGLAIVTVVWVILAEIYPTAIRGRALGLATFFLWVADYAVTQTFPIMDAKDSWFVQHFNHAFPFYVYAAFCVVLVVVVWRFVPETKGRTLEEIERMWPGRQSP